MSDESKITVMLVDDDTLLLDMYGRKFESEGIEVMKVTSPEDCLEELRGDSNPNILLMDLVMTGIGGIGLLKAIREEGLAKDTSIFILSNQTQENDIEEIDKFKIDGFIMKAEIKPSELVEKVKSAYLNK